MNSGPPRRGVARGSLLLSCLLLTGCETAREYSLTYRLWTNGEMSRFAEAAPDPRLAMFINSTNGQVLVLYDECVESRDFIRRRAYLLEPNLDRIAANQKPLFVDPNVAAAMTPISQMPAPGDSTNCLPAPDLAFFIDGTRREFSLCRRQEVDGPYMLPVYADSRGTLVRSLLSPFAVAGDVVMVGVVAAVAAGLAWAYSGFQYH